MKEYDDQLQSVLMALFWSHCHLPEVQGKDEHDKTLKGIFHSKKNY